MYKPYLKISFNDTLTNDIVSFEQLGPGLHFSLIKLKSLSRVSWLAMMAQLDACPLGDQEVAGSAHTGSATFFRRDCS